MGKPWYDEPDPVKRYRKSYEITRSIHRCIDSTTIDPEHARLAREGWLHITNHLRNEATTKDSFFSHLAKEVEEFGYEMCVCQTAYDIYGHLVPDLVSIWARKKS